MIGQYEQQLQQNPNEAEESFDRSVSMKRFRVTSDLMMGGGAGGNQSMRMSPRPFPNHLSKAGEEQPPTVRLSGQDKRSKIGQQGLTLAQVSIIRFKMRILVYQIT